MKSWRSSGIPAARAGGKVIVVQLSAAQKSDGATDFDDLRQAAGIDAVKAQIEDGLKAAPERARGGHGESNLKDGVKEGRRTIGRETRGEEGSAQERRARHGGRRLISGRYQCGVSRVQLWAPFPFPRPMATAI